MTWYIKILLLLLLLKNEDILCLMYNEKKKSHTNRDRPKILSKRGQSIKKKENSK